MTRTPKISGWESNRENATGARGGAAAWLAAVGAALALVVAPAAASAHDVEGPCSFVMDPNNAPVSNPRLDHLTVAGTNVNVLVPPGYNRDDRAHGRRYPVLYLFHGAFSDEDSFSTQTDLLAYTASLPEHQQVIVVMPDGGHLPTGRDWVDGSHTQETYVINTLIPYIDDHYRTIGDGAHRAAAGFSAGGMNATLYAARHPEMFAATASFSGFLDPYSAEGQTIVQAFVGFEDELCGGSVEVNSLWGDPISHPMGWIGYDPVYLARGLANVSVYVASANGEPCPEDADADPFLFYAESVVYGMSQNFDHALTAAGVRHTTHFRTCGVHKFSNSNQDLREFWPQMFDAFGRRTARSFDHRAGAASASAWGWTFGAEANRAPEFLDVTGASRTGVTLTGSGVVSVTTAAIFGRRESVTLTGLGVPSQTVQADDAGRITFRADLGAAHSLEQYTTQEQALEAGDPDYFTTRRVSFWRGFDGEGGCGWGRDGDDD